MAIYRDSPGQAGFEPGSRERFHAAQKCTWVSVLVNIVLTMVQIVVGYLGRSQALMADGLHSFSDLLTDIMVLFANWFGKRSADANHPYGHARIETATTLILGIFLAAIGAGLVWAAATRLQHFDTSRPVHIATLWVAIVTLIAKESLFRYMMGVAKQLRSQMLMANAWHSRSDAASSLVVVVGIGGNLAGFTSLDLLAAAIVGFMIVRLGWQLSYQALAELVDTGLSDEEVDAIRATLLSTPGVKGIHELRTRKMGDYALVDAHVIVSPKISVSEGHYIAEAARTRVLSHYHVLDVLVHIDPEDDRTAKPSEHLPPREEVLTLIARSLSLPAADLEQTVLHYLDGKVEADIFLPECFVSNAGGLPAMQQQLEKLVTGDSLFRAIHVHERNAP